MPRPMNDVGQVKVRLPKSLQGVVRAAAHDNRRSINAEIVYRLREYDRQWAADGPSTRLARIEALLEGVMARVHLPDELHSNSEG